MSEKSKFKPDPKLRLMDQVRQVLRYHHYAYRTEQTYCDWILRYIRFHGGKTHPKNMGKTDIEAFLSHLAVNCKVAAATQRLALNAIVFLYKNVLDTPIAEDLTPVKAKRHRRPPVVMTHHEVKLLLSHMTGVHLLMAKISYGGGLRLMECIRLRIRDFDFERNMVFIRGAKGGKDRETLFPESVHSEVKEHIKIVEELHEKDLAAGAGEVYLPDALARKYRSAPREFGWQYLFPAKKLSDDPRSGKTRRHHVDPSGFQKAVKAAARKANIIKPVGTHTLRHSFATHLLDDGVNIRVVQQLMGHADVKTTEIYTHVMKKNIEAITSPLDLL
jgi:integron integrase